MPKRGDFERATVARTSGQQPLFDPERGKALREEGIARAASSKDAKRKSSKVLTIVYRVARVRREFTTDDVEAHMERAGIERFADGRALGPIMRKALGAGWIARTDRTRVSDMPGCHRRPKAVWRSLLWTAR